ncbi:MAG: iron-sulfur cluster assembly accessory protein [Holosporales bacterium]|jgi:iron-sulfur cluster assembly accessory protein|nr:iron-sulfur cluster assembly accessory protein [Holosporales bacterium]
MMVNILVTTAALDKISEVMQERQPPPVGIRIFVYNDGNGVAHSMNFTDEVSITDEVFDIGGITFITDANSSIFLNNVVLDFVTIDANSGFVFQEQCTTRSCLTCKGACRRN